jgi:hypothetical protein
MQAVGGGSLVQRMIGAARLDAHTYEEVERDTSATTQAAIVVALAAIAGGIGSTGDEGGTGFIGGIISMIVFWAIFSGVAYLVGTRLTSTAATSSSWQEVMRTLGFAFTPLLISVVGFVPILGGLLALVGLIWFLVTATLALRHALDMSTGRAIGTAVISLLPAAFISGIILSIFGIGR